MTDKPIPDHVHGTASGYRDWKCRCETCVAAKSKRNAIERLNRLARPIPDHVHGTANGYVNYCCRCDECKEAVRLQRRWTQSKKAQKGDGDNG